MFGGIIQSVAPVLSGEMRGGVRQVRIRRPKGWRLKEGQSISVNGICSTISAFSRTSFEVEYMSETLARTTAQNFATGVLVNLERPLTLSGYIDGHLVAGHVDAKGSVVSFEKELLTVEIGSSLMKYLSEKGSVAVNGVAMTIVGIGRKTFSVALIPFTAAHTNLGACKAGYEVNVEVDMFARYIERLTKRAEKR